MLNNMTNEIISIFKQRYCGVSGAMGAWNYDDCRPLPNATISNEARCGFDISSYNETILFVRDTSFWNNRDQGLVITDVGVYCIPDNEKPDEKLVFNWNDITHVTTKDDVVFFWVNDEDAYQIHMSFFFKYESEYRPFQLVSLLDDIAKAAVDPIQQIWDKFANKYDNETDPNKRISLVEEMQAQLPSESWPIASGYVLLGNDYAELGDAKKALRYYRLGLDHDTCEYASVWYGNVCYQIESLIDLQGDKQNIYDISWKRTYALMAARFADNDEKHQTTNGENATSREDAVVDFNRFDDEYTEHFLELPYKDRKTLLIVKTFDNLFQDHFVTLHIDSDRSALIFPTGHPLVNEVYVAHPLTTNRYMPIESYQLELIEDRVREFCELAQGLGATEINIECLNSNSNDSTNSGNRNISGGASRMSSVHGSGHDEYSRRLIEEISRSISLHQTFQPHKAPALPDNLLWYSGEPSWQRLYRQRMEGGLLTHEERIETKKSQVVDNREMKEIKAELETLFANLDVAFDKTEEAKFEQQENAVLAISVKFAPLSQLTGSTSSMPQVSMFTSNEQKYIDEVKECLADGEITRTGRRLLNMHRERLGISESRASELEASIATPQLTDEEKEYLEAYREACEDGQLSDKERRMLNRLRDMLGITEERANEIEKQ